MSGGARSLEPWRWLGVPMLQVLAATMVFAVPLRFWGIGLPEPLFAMPIVFAWAVIRPSVLAPFCVVLLGLFMDLLWGAPTAFWSVCLLLGYGMVIGGRAMLQGQSRGVMWASYGVMTGLSMGSAYLITMLDVKTMPNPLPVFWQYLATVVLYPFADRLIERFEDADVRFR
jgi:rod shape-determining protein MreD